MDLHKRRPHKGHPRKQCRRKGHRKQHQLGLLEQHSGEGRRRCRGRRQQGRGRGSDRSRGRGRHLDQLVCNSQRLGVSRAGTRLTAARRTRCRVSRGRCL